MSTNRKRNARVAGLIYLVIAVLAPLRLIYIPSVLIVEGDAAATADNIAAHELLFRFGILADLVVGTAAIFVTLALYRLLHEVDRGLAVLLVILGGLMVTPIYFLNTVNDAAALLLVRGTDFLSAFGEPAREALAYLFLRLHDHGVLANQVFWGLWLFPFGMLVFRSGFLPRFLGVWLIVGGFGYLALSPIGLLAPQYETIAGFITLPAGFGEIAILLWLLIRGAEEDPA